MSETIVTNSKSSVKINNLKKMILSKEYGKYKFNKTDYEAVREIVNDMEFKCENDIGLKIYGSLQVFNLFIYEKGKHNKNYNHYGTLRE